MKKKSVIEVLVAIIAILVIAIVAWKTAVLWEEVGKPLEIVWDENKTLTEDYTVEKGKTLIIKPGVNVYLDSGVNITVNGTLRAEGKSDSLITFTHKDDSEYWGCIFFTLYATEGLMKYCKVEYGGGLNNSGPAIACAASPTISHCEISNNKGGIFCYAKSSSLISYNTVTHNEGLGIYCFKCAPEISHNIISYNGQNGIMCRELSCPEISYNTISYNTMNGIICVYGGTANVHQNDIYDNGGFGIYNPDTSVVVNATYNFWGSTDGPGGEGPGSGDEVSDNVEFYPWLTKPATTTEPIAGFTYFPLYPDVNETIYLNDTSVDNGFIVSWHWDFGDGNTGKGENTTHKYSNAGMYNITLTVTDNAGEVGRCIKTINVGVDVYLLCCELEYPLQAFDDVGTFNFICAVPCDYEDQVPIFFEICNDTTANITGYEIVSQNFPNIVINFTIAQMKKNEKVILHLKYWVLVRNKHYDDLQRYVEIPRIDDLPDDTKIWLASTNAIQSNNSEIIEIALQLRNNNSNLIEIAENISKYMVDVPWQGGVPQDALSALHNGGVCTGHANLGTALFRANNIPAKNLIVIPTTGEWLQWHFISEYYCPDYGWVWVETSLGQTPFEPKNSIVLRVNYPEDENEAGVKHGGVEQIYWLSTEDVSVVPGGTVELCFTRAWSEAETFTDSHSANNAFLVTQSVHDLYINYVGKNLSAENKTHFDNGLEAQSNAIVFLSGNDILRYIDQMKIAYNEYNNVK